MGFRQLVTDAHRLGFSTQDALRNAVSVGDDQQRAPDGKFGGGGSGGGAGKAGYADRAKKTSAYLAGVGPRPGAGKSKAGARQKQKNFNKKIYGV